MLPIGEDHLDYANRIASELRAKDIRVTVDSRSERIGGKIRLARNERVPYMVVVGDSERDAERVTLRQRDGDQTEMALTEMLDRLVEENRY